MTWSLWQPTKVTNIQATLVDGGTLEANTTYYIRVQALDNGESYRTVPFYLWSGAHILGPYSDVVIITTDSTKRSISLTWDKVFKSDGVTEVNAYEVLITKDPADFDLEHAKLACTTGYTEPATSTNSYIITAPANIWYSHIPHGVPLLTWDGAGTATFESLHEWLTSNGYSQFTATLPMHVTAAVAYRFIGHIKIKPEISGGYAHSMLWQNVTILGGLDVASCRVSWKNALLNIFTRSHGGGSRPDVNSAGSTVEGIALWNMLVPDALLAPSPSRSWVRYIPEYYLTRNVYETFRTNLIGYGSNTTIDLLQLQPVLRPNIEGGIRSAITWLELLQNLAQGQYIISSEYIGNLGAPSWCMELTNNYEYWQFPGGQLVDCVTNANNYYGKTGITFDRRVQFSVYYGKDLGNVTVPLFRRLRIVVLDENNAPLQNAKVSVWGAGGQNLTIGYEEADLSWLATGYRTDGRNWQRAEETIKHDDTDVWLYERTYAGSAQPTAGKTYWIHGERLRLVEQLQIDGDWELWRTERGLTNTIPGWLYGLFGYMPLIAAPDFHLTDATGEVWNVTPLVVYKHAYDNPHWDGWLFDVPANVGSLTFYTPITVRVEADGYQTWEATYPLELLESTGVKPFVIVSNMKPVTPPVTVLRSLSANLQDISLSANLQEIKTIEAKLNV